MRAVLQTTRQKFSTNLPNFGAGVQLANTNTNTNANANAMSAAVLRECFQAARASGKRAKDAAQSLGVSEGEAVAAHTCRHDLALKAVPLKSQWLELLQALQLCGPVMALTRNEAVVHEKIGIYQNISATGHMGLALGDDIDLRLFFSCWYAGFAVLEPANDAKNPPTQSLQFFDMQGVAVHKIFVRPETDREAFNNIVQRFSEPEKTHHFTPAPAKAIARLDTEIDAMGLAQAWAAMTDTHQFFGLLGKFGTQRQQSFRLVEGRFTQRVQRTAVSSLLNEAAMDGTPIMVFVSSGGCIQIHSGTVLRIEAMATPTAHWINVLDARFNLHLREDLIADVWIVQKPTEDGMVTSVEVFDANGDLIVMFFGSRKPGIAEQLAWRCITARLPRLEATPA